jgi:hypothetical protein
MNYQGINTKEVYRRARRFLVSFALWAPAVAALSYFLQAQSAPNLAALKKKVVSVGKLEFKRDVPVKYYAKARLQEYLDASFKKDYPLQTAQKDAVFIRLMGFTHKTVDVRGIRRRILLDNAVGLYDEKTKELLALEDYRQINYFNSMILAHELRHAIQDSHFNLSELMKPYSDYDDRKLAVLAAVEGDATFLMVECGGLDPNILASSHNSDALMSFTPAPKPTLLYREPEVIKYQLVMPYIVGLRFVNAVYKKKKWKGVNRILSRPPDSSEQILHPEKYLKREPPVTVQIQFEPDGYDLFHSGVIGEYFLGILLKPRGQEVFIDYAGGWGGDKFHIYKHPHEASYFLAWESVWDKETFCSHFYTHFKRFIENSFSVNFKKGSVKVYSFVAGRGGSDYFFIMKSNNKMFYARSNNRKVMNTFIFGGNYD